MLGHREYWRELWRLVRGARDNPLVEYGKPWRRGPARQAFFFLQLAVGLGVLAWTALRLALHWDLQASSGQPFRELITYDYDHFAMLVLCAMFTMPINLLIVSIQWCERKRLEDLWMTRLDSREMAFGSVFWGMIGGLVLPSIMWLGLCLSVLVEHAYNLTMLRWDVFIGYFENAILPSLVLLATGGAFLHLVALGSLKAWFPSGMSKAFVLPNGPAVACAYILFLHFILVHIGNVLSNSHLWQGIAPFVAIIIFLAAAMRSAGRFAPSMFIAPIDPDRFAHFSVLGNELQRVRDSEWRAKVRASLRRHVPIPWGHTAHLFLRAVLWTLPIIVWQVYLLIVAYDARQAARVGRGYAAFETPLILAGLRDWFYAHGWVAINAWLALTIVMLYARHRRRGGLPMVAGAAVTSILRQLAPLILLGVALALVLPMLAWHGFAVFVLGFLWVSIAGFVFVFAFPRLRRMAIWLYMAFVLFVSGQIHYRVHIAMGTWGAWWDQVWTAFHLLGVIVCFNTIPLFQRLYDKHLRGVAPGELVIVTGDPPEPAMGSNAAPLMPHRKWGRSSAMAPLDIVFFDVAFTLIRPEPGVGALYAGTAREFGTDVAADRLDAAFGPAWREVRRATDGPPYGPSDAQARAFWRRVVEQTFRRAGSRMPADPYFDTVFDRFARPESWRVYDDVEGAFGILRAARVKIGVLSNFDSRLRPLLGGLGLLGRIDHLLISCEAGVEKPAVELFRLAERTAGVASPARAALVGDQAEEDYEGARAAGWRAALIDRTQPPDPPRRFDHLARAVEHLLA